MSLSLNTTPADYLKERESSSDWQWLATAMLTGVESLRRTYNRDGLQKQAFEKVHTVQFIGVFLKAPFFDAGF